MSDRNQLIDVFEDTREYCLENAYLKQAIADSIANTKIFPADIKPILRDSGREGIVTVTRHRTYEAAVKLHGEHPDKRIAVLNFASATNPGGGVAKGASAQEECLCRCSTLYPVLCTPELRKRYYGPNHKKDNLHDDTCIYTPGIVICKTDEDMPQRTDSFVPVDVISCAAPNLRPTPANMYNHEGGIVLRITNDKLYELHHRRAMHILHAAQSSGADMLVLGAFGCGAFMNDPYTVAAAYRDVMKKYRQCFDLVEFAVYCSDKDTVNFTAFNKAMLQI